MYRGKYRSSGVSGRCCASATTLWNEKEAEREGERGERGREREREKGERIGFMILLQFLFHSIVSISYFWSFRVNLQFNRFV